MIRGPDNIASFETIQFTVFCLSRDFILPFYGNVWLIAWVNRSPTLVRNVDSYFCSSLLGIIHKKKASAMSSNHTFRE